MSSIRRNCIGSMGENHLVNPILCPPILPASIVQRMNYALLLYPTVLFLSCALWPVYKHNVQRRRESFLFSSIDFSGSSHGCLSVLVPVPSCLQFMIPCIVQTTGNFNEINVITLLTVWHRSHSLLDHDAVSGHQDSAVPSSTL
jgi:hypothetical protein